MMKLHSILFLCLSLLLAGCQSSQSSQTTQKTLASRADQTLRLNILGEPQSLDPRKARELSSLTISRMLFEGLTRVNLEDKAELALAKKVDVSEDMKTYTFYLRHTQWTNGDPVTAYDFDYAWKKVLDPRFPGDNAFQLYPIKNAKKIKQGELAPEELGVKVLDPMTLRIELESPLPYFLELVAFPAFFPVNHKVDQLDPHWAANATTFVSNGPFSLKLWKHNDLVEVTRNRHYWDSSAVKIQDIQMVMVKEETEWKMYEKKELDWAGSPLSVLPLDALPKLKKQSILKTKPMLGTFFLRTNTQRPPFNHQLMRRAFALAINRKEIVDHIAQGSQIPATGLVPLSMGVQKQPYFADGNVEEAKALFAQALRESGYTEKTLPAVKLTYASSERSHLVAQAIQQQLSQAFGIDVQLEGMERKVYYGRVSKQDFQLALGSWIADINDPSNFLEVFKFKTTGTNNTLWENSDYARLLDESAQIADKEKRYELLGQCEEILIQEMPVIPLFYGTLLYVNNSRIRDVVLSSLGSLDFKWAELHQGIITDNSSTQEKH